MSIAPAAFTAFRSKEPLTRFREIENELGSFRVEHLSAYRDLDYNRLAVLAESIRSFSVVTPLRLMLGVVAEVEQRIEPLVRFHPYISAESAVAAGRASTRDELFTAERGYAVPTVSGFNFYLGSIYEHVIDSTQL